jgi:hypothetical protein
MDTTLPGKTDLPMGDTIPKMLVLSGTSPSDHIEASLGKLGIKEFKQQDSRDVMANEAELKKYHVVFNPCSTSSDKHTISSAMSQAAQKYVEAGGKLYVTDWSYEWAKIPFGDHLQMDGTGTAPGSRTVSSYNAPGIPQDPGLRDWLIALGEPQPQLIGNYTRINSVANLPGLDEDLKDVTITPKVWINARESRGEHPATVSFNRGCGRVLFSSYHTEGQLSGGSTELLGQEKALLYILLEVTACAGQIGPPQ